MARALTSTSTNPAIRNSRAKAARPIIASPYRIRWTTVYVKSARKAAADAAQCAWLHLLNHLDDLRDPAALPGWLSTTARRECSRVLRAAARPHTAGYVLDAETPDERAATADQELLKAERHAALREAFAALPPSGQPLLAMLTADPPVPYAEISARLCSPAGSIGPTRRRYLGKLRRHRPSRR
jgi:RNA polymerase sigma factor (sigma-70 family)